MKVNVLPGQVNVTPDLASLELALNKAYGRYKVAADAYEAASRDRTDALNQLNNAQKAIDEAVRGLKNVAPSDSDWRRKTA